MSRFIYKARNASGELVSDEIEAPSKEEVIKNLAAREYTPVSVEDKGMVLTFSGALGDLSRVKTRDLSIFFRQLAAIFSAGVPLYESLVAMEDQISHGGLRRVISGLILDVEGGSTFSQALAKHPLIFSKLIITMVEAGERGGVLGDVLARIAAYLEKENEFQQKIKAALRYPIMVLTALLLAFIFAVTFIIPKFNNIFSSFKTALPLPTRILLGINYAFANYWLAILIFMALAYFCFRFYLSLPFGKKQFDLLILRLPVLGLVITKLALSRFFRMLSAMISSGIPLVYGLEVTANTADNSVIAETIMDIRKQILAGSSLSLSMHNYKLFPSTAYHMIAIGEKSGNLEQMLVKSADYFDEETDYTVSNLMSLIEPLLILLLGGMVLLLALGIFLPMWSMMQLYT